ncbi:MAG: DUF2062 domain-containing protein [Alphaproteobacteria bacterium]|nr:DUF2062 domain-containing protein [Alphaproteobacteria bacterium]
MLFRRSIPTTRADRILRFLWPSMSLRRVISYYKRRVARLPGTPHSIASGFAAGAAVSFTPFMGFHFILGAALAYFIRGNLVASALGTLIGNPWTFPFIWIATYELGSNVLSNAGHGVPKETLSFSYLIDHIGDVLIPMSLGGLILSIIIFPLVYFPLRLMIQRFRDIRFAKRQRRAKLQVQHVTEESA